MPYWMKQLMARGYMDEAADDGAAAGGAGGSGADDEAVKAAKKAADDRAAEEARAAAAGSKISDNEAKLLKENLAKKAKLEELTKRYEGIDPDEYRKLVSEKQQREEEAKKRETEEAEKRGEFDRVKGQMVAEHQKELKAVRDEKEKFVSEIAAKDRVIHDLTIGNAFGNSKLIQEKLALSPAKAKALFGSHFEYVDGKIVGYDKPHGEKDRTPITNASGDSVSFEEALTKIVDADPDKDQLYRAKQQPGAGGRGNPHGRSEPRDPGTGVARISAGLKKIGAAT